MVGDEDEEEEINVVGELTLDEHWADGKFKVNINRCHDCDAHYQYSRHSEDELIELFNEIGDAVIALFPNAVI